MENSNKVTNLSCDAKIIKSRTLPECSNKCEKPYGKKGPLVTKIPVVIAEPTIQIDVESLIQLEEPALEIKRIKKNIFITQCKLLPKTGKLFIGGFVRKNIEYANVTCIADKVISGDIKHTTLNVPFDCVTKIEYDIYPEFLRRDETKEFEVFTGNMKGCLNSCNKTVIGKDFCEQDFEDFEVFNEKIFCELVEAKIFEEDIHKEPKSIGECFPNEHVFDKLTEKMVIYVKLKLLQFQQVSIPGIHDGACEPPFDITVKKDK